ncbi:MAG: GntR family transcriptional regulator [Lachnospiraceae bacterium]
MREKNTLKDTVYQSILNGILSGEFKQSQILTEKELVEKYSCSKSPVREALTALCNERVLLSHPRYGYEIVRLTKEDVDDIMEYRLLLESALLKEYYRSLSEHQFQQLQILDDVCNNTLNSDLWSHWDANTRFHLALASFSNNRYITSQLGTAMATLKRAYAQFYWHEWSVRPDHSDVRFHEKLICHLKEKDIEQSLSCLKDDLSDFCL